MSISRGSAGATPIVTTVTNTTPSPDVFVEKPIHAEYSRFFESKSGINGDQLKYVVAWAEDGAKGVGDALSKLKSLDRKLGITPDTNRLTKIYNHIRISNNTNIIKQQKKEAIGNVVNSSEEKIGLVRSEYSAKIKELNEKISELRAKQSEATKQMRTHATRQSAEIKRRFDQELTDLEKMRKAYE
jgi:wobble nucleotide-excising tRNase